MEEAVSNFPVKVVTHAPDEKGMKAFMYQDGWVVLKSSKQKKAAKDYLNFFISPENNQHFNEMLGQGATNRKAKSSGFAENIAFKGDELAKYAYFPDFTLPPATERHGQAVRNGDRSAALADARARGAGLIVPALVVIVVLLGPRRSGGRRREPAPLRAGCIGSVHDAPLTLGNYADLVRPAYAGYFADTFGFSLVATLLALLLAYPIGYRVAREARPRVRRAWIAFLVVMLFLSILIRVYSVSLAVGPAGFGRGLSNLLGLTLNSRGYAEISVVLGLLHCLVPMAVIVLLAPLGAESAARRGRAGARRTAVEGARHDHDPIRS